MSSQASPGPEGALRALADLWADLGAGDEAQELRALMPAARAAAPKQTTPSRPAAASAAASAPPRTPAPLPIKGRANPIAEARALAAAARTLPELKAAVEAFHGCPLRASARSTVVYDGALDAPILLIGEAPGADEDIQGLPFVGRSGQLLDRMLAAIGLFRTRNVLITNTVFWRPPGNRDPHPDETIVCAPFVERQIELLRPKLMLTAGRRATETLLKATDGIMRLAGRKMSYRQEGLSPIPCVPLLHPSYLLRRPQDKARAWTDLLAVAALADELGLDREGAL